MPRIRSIFPGQWTDEDFVTITPLARLLALGIRNIADDNGIFEWKPTSIKMWILPVDNVDMDALFAELIASNIVARFIAHGRPYGAIRNFCRFQRPKKPSSQYPLPGNLTDYVGKTGPKGPVQDALLPLGPDVSSELDMPSDDDSSELASLEGGVISAKGGNRKTEGGGRREEIKGGGKESPTTPVPRESDPESRDLTSVRPSMANGSANGTGSSALKHATPTRFEEFWDQAYPHRAGRKKGRKAAEAKYAAAVKRGVSEDAIIAGAKASRSDPDVIRGFARDPTTWLNQEGWRDEPPKDPPNGPNGGGTLSSRFGSMKDHW